MTAHGLSHAGSGPAAHTSHVTTVTGTVTRCSRILTGRLSPSPSRTTDSESADTVPVTAYAALWAFEFWPTVTGRILLVTSLREKFSNDSEP
jgi:hypothetical protein